MTEAKIDRSFSEVLESETATSQYSGANRPTIGETTISTAEASMIRKEVRSAIQQAFPGINFSTSQP